MLPTMFMKPLTTPALRLPTSRQSSLLCSSRPIEQLPQLRQERVREDGLGQTFDSRVEDTVVRDGVFRISRHIKNLQLGPEHGEALGELPSAHARHHDVGEEHVDRARELLADEQRLASVLR